MNKPPDFLARQLLDDLDMLVEQVALRLRQVPWYQTADPHALRMMIRQDCLALTAALARSPEFSFPSEIRTARLR